MKPSWEPICLARKPLIGTVAANVLAHGTGALNVGACRVGDEELPEMKAGAAKLGTFERSDMVMPARAGRFPANILHDGSDEVAEAFPQAPGQQREVNDTFAPSRGTPVYGDFGPRNTAIPRGDAGSAARFFYSAKADAEDRLGSRHPTVKPVDLMRWLVRLITPRGGVTLDPFAGTGTTGAAAYWEGCRAILCEREAAYQDDIRRRMAYLLAGQDERKRLLAKLAADEAGDEADPLPLFS